MDDLRLPRTEVSCPVPECPWKYDLTNPRMADETLTGGPVRMVIPPPAGEHLRPVEIAAGVAAAQRPRMVAPVRTFTDLASLIMTAAREQDDAVTAAHLSSHSYAELAEAFGERLDTALALLAGAGYHPATPVQ